MTEFYRTGILKHEPRPTGLHKSWIWLFAFNILDENYENESGRLRPTLLTDRGSEAMQAAIATEVMITGSRSN